MQIETEVPVSNEAELDREMREIIAKWVARGEVADQDLRRYQELSMKRALLMNGGGRLWSRARKHAAA